LTLERTSFSGEVLKGKGQQAHPGCRYDRSRASRPLLDRVKTKHAAWRSATGSLCSPPRRKYRQALLEAQKKVIATIL